MAAPYAARTRGGGELPLNDRMDVVGGDGRGLRRPQPGERVVRAVHARCEQMHTDDGKGGETGDLREQDDAEPTRQHGANSL
jgi:hypothetical protein